MDDAHAIGDSQLSEDTSPSAPEETPEGSPKKGLDLDRWLNITLLVILIAILGLAIWFVLQVRADRIAAEEANPALRVVRAMQEQVKNSPNDVILRVRLAEALGAAGEYDDAVEQLNAALQIEPEHVGAYLDLGIIALETEDLVAAERYFLRVIELTEVAQFTDVDRRRELAYYNLGRIALQDSRYEDAIANLKGAQRIRSDASDTYYHLALAYKGLEEYEAAVEQLETALAFDPNYAAALYQLGLVHLEQDDKINAAYALQRTSELEPDADIVFEALSTLGTAEDWVASAQEKFDAGDVEGAVHDILVARNLAPDSVDAAVLHGDILIAKGDLNGAAAVYQEALELEPENAEIQAKIDGIGGQ